MQQMLLYWKTYCSLNMFRGTIMPIIWSSRVFLRCVIPVVLSQILQCTICMYYIYIQSETQQLIDGITMYYTLHCNKRHVSAL